MVVVKKKVYVKNRLCEKCTKKKPHKIVICVVYTIVNKTKKEKKNNTSSKTYFLSYCFFNGERVGRFVLLASLSISSVAAAQLHSQFCLP